MGLESPTQNSNAGKATPYSGSASTPAAKLHLSARKPAVRFVEKRHISPALPPLSRASPSSSMNERAAINRWWTNRLRLTTSWSTASTKARDSFQNDFTRPPSSPNTKPSLISSTRRMTAFLWAVGRPGNLWRPFRGKVEEARNTSMSWSASTESGR